MLAVSPAGLFCIDRKHGTVYRECPDYDELRDHMAELIAESMHAIGDQFLLSIE